MCSFIIIIMPLKCLHFSLINTAHDKSTQKQVNATSGAGDTGSCSVNEAKPMMSQSVYHNVTGQIDATFRALQKLLESNRRIILGHPSLQVTKPGEADRETEKKCCGSSNIIIDLNSM